MTTSAKLTTIAENQQRVYEAGKAAEKTEFWESLQQGGNRTNYDYAFCRIGDRCYDPIYPIDGSCNRLFNSCSITDTKVPIVVRGAVNYAFSYNSNLKIIRSLDLTEMSEISNMFYGSNNIETINFVGTIKLSGLSLANQTKLSRESLLSLLNCLEQKTDGGEWVVTLGSTNKAKLTADELKVAEDKGWKVN